MPDINPSTFSDFVCTVSTESLYQVHTAWNNMNSYVNIVTKSKRFLIFQVRSCRSANVFLMERPDSLSTAIQLILGDAENTRTVIRLPDGQMTQTSTPNILSCNLYRQFWINWDLGSIKVGKGIPNEDQFLEVEYTVSSVTVFGVSTEHEVVGDWRFSRDEGICKFDARNL